MSEEQFPDDCDTANRRPSHSHANPATGLQVRPISGSGGRLTLNVVSSWWQDEAKKYGVHFEQHDDRYARTAEWLHTEIARITDVKSSGAGYKNYQQWLAGTQLENQVSLEDYSVSNRGLRSGLVGTPDQVAERVAAFEAVGVNFLLLQCSPQLEEMERFSEAVIQVLAK